MSAIAVNRNGFRHGDIQDELAMRKLDAAMASDLRQLGREMRQFEGALHRTEGQIEQQWRQAHLGYGPSRPWSWTTKESRSAQASA